MLDLLFIVFCITGLLALLAHAARREDAARQETRRPRL